MERNILETQTINILVFVTKIIHLLPSYQTTRHHISKDSNVHRVLNIILLYKFQQDAHVTEFILSDNCSTCFGRYYHPSSGAQTTVTTASGNGYAVSLSAIIVEELELI